MRKYFLLPALVFLSTGCKSTPDPQNGQLLEVRATTRPTATAASISSVQWATDEGTFSTTCEQRPGKTPDIFRKCAASYGLNRLATGSWQTDGTNRTSPRLELNAPVTFKRTDDKQENETIYIAIGVRSGSFKRLTFDIKAANGDVTFVDERYSPDTKIGGVFSGKTELRVLKAVVPFSAKQKIAEYDLIIGNLQVNHVTGVLFERPEITLFSVEPEEYARIKNGSGYPNMAYRALTSLRLE